MARSTSYAPTRSARPVRKRRTYDFTLLFITLVLVLFGFIMIYSTSSYTAQLKGLDADYYAKRQMWVATAGFAIMLVVSLIHYRMLIDFKVPLLKINPAIAMYITALALQILVLVIGQEINGAKRWISIAGQSFQPSDFSKLAAIVFVSFLAKLSGNALDSLWGFLRVLVYMAPLIVLIALENLSTALIVGGITVGICYVTSKNRWYFFLCVIVAIGAVAAYIFLGEGFRAERIEIWKNVETHEKGFQILQGLYAIASGGINGVGLGASRQKLGYIPEAQNDMIFSIICEELGLLGAIVIVGLFVFLLWRIYIIAVSTTNLYGALLCTGVFIHIALQVVLNIAVVTNTIPSTGVALPFISYGGTSVLILLVEIGLVLSVSKQIGSNHDR